MRLGEHVVRFSMGLIPVVGNTVTGTIVGLTSDGAQLCNLMLEHEIDQSEIPADCYELVDYLGAHGFLSSPDAPHCPALRSAYLHVTNQCNLACIGCYSRDAARNWAVDPSLIDLEHAVTVLARIGVERLVISGGEPFVRKDLAKLTEFAKTRGMREVAVLTNGTLCTRERLDELAGSVDTISVSFDGASSDAPAYLRDAQRFDRLCDAIAKIKAVGIHPHILPTIHAYNVDDVTEYLTLGEKLGTSVGFSLLSGSRTELCELFPTDACLTHLAETMSALGQRASDDSPFATRDGGLAARRSCGAGKTGVSVAADGSVFPCHMLHAPEFCLGNAYRDTPGALIGALERFSMPSVDKIDGCRDCDKRYLCGGGCRARGFLSCGRLDARDPYCSYYERSIALQVQSLLSSATKGGE